MFIGPADDNINENLCIRPDENSENIENVELVQVLSVIRDEQVIQIPCPAIHHEIDIWVQIVSHLKALI